MNATFSRSDALKPMAWIVATLIGFFIILAYLESPDWLLVLVGYGLMAAIALYFCAYVYFMFTNPDALRSEKYQLEKLAIEKRFYGDSLTGPIEDVTVLKSVKSGTAKSIAKKSR